jgi:hypothetical protein
MKESLNEIFPPEQMSVNRLRLAPVAENAQPAALSGSYGMGSGWERTFTTPGATRTTDSLILRVVFESFLCFRSLFSSGAFRHSLETNSAAGGRPYSYYMAAALLCHIGRSRCTWRLMPKWHLLSHEHLSIRRSCAGAKRPGKTINSTGGQSSTRESAVGTEPAFRGRANGSDEGGSKGPLSGMAEPVSYVKLNRKGESCFRYCVRMAT